MIMSTYDKTIFDALGKKDIYIYIHVSKREVIQQW